MVTSRSQFHFYAKLYRFSRFGRALNRFPKKQLRKWLGKELNIDAKNSFDPKWKWLGHLVYTVEDTNNIMIIDPCFWGQRVSYVSKGYYEYAVMAYLKKTLGEGDVFIDIGANIGFFSVFASGKVGNTGRVLSFEPSPGAFKMLSAHTYINRLKNVELFNMALFDSTGTLKMKVEDEGGRGSIRSSASFEDEIEVLADRFDNLNTQIPNNAKGFCKIDVEGAEMTVIKGMSEFISSHPNFTYMLEVTPAWLSDFGDSADNMFDVFRKHGFKFYKVHSAGILEEHDGKALKYQENFIIKKG